MIRKQAGNGISAPPEIAFADVVKMIDTARQHAYHAVNTTLIELYWQVGAYISAKLAAAEWGDGVVDQLARHLALSQPGLRGFTRRNLFRMRQFYDTYRDVAKVSALLTQLPWTHNLIMLSQSKRAEEREFYLRTAIREKWSSRELERQFRVALFERTVLEPAKVSATLWRSHPDALGVFKDSYLVEFLDLTRFEPEYLGKLSFYLEALDRDHRKAHENPGVGVLLCASKDDEVVEYALSRTLSPAVIADYHTQLPDKKLLQAKLREFYALDAGSEEPS